MRKIQFFSTVDGLSDLFPIIPAREYRPSWISDAKNHYKSIFNSSNEKNLHIYKCPGIFDIMSEGYIVPLPWDIAIETDHTDSKNFKWTIPSGLLEDKLGNELIKGHFAPDVQSLPNRPYSLDTIIKFNTPWYVVAPRDVKFLVIPIPYSENWQFESVHGILDPGYSAEVNVQVRWNLKNGRHVIKAGTPMCQLIPLSNEEFELEVRTATEKDKKWIQKRDYFFNFSFLFKRNLMKKMYHKFWNS